jgi:hypothetical protein
MTKVCTKCGKSKPLDKFAKCKKNKSGLAAICLDCAAAMTRVYRQTHLEIIRGNERSYRQANLEAVRVRDRKRGVIKRADPAYNKWRNQWLAPHLEWLNSLKNVSCADCEGYFPPEAMDFDHVRGKKVKQISCMKGMKRERILFEIAKCDLICTNCHRIRTIARKRKNKISESRPAREIYYEKINALKSNPCSDCGKRFPPEVMDFDHVRGTKSICVGRMCDTSWPQVLIELAKCDLVCANCHRIRTRNRKRKHSARQKSLKEAA